MTNMIWCLMLLLVLLVVLCQLNRSSHGHPIMGGADTPFQVTARRLRLRNVGTTAFRFSKLGVYPSENDATVGQNELLAMYQSNLLMSTAGLTTFHGSAIDMSPNVYDTVSARSYASLQPNDALVIDWTADVSFSAIRLGAFDAGSTPNLCRLQCETSVGSQPSDAFTPLFLTFQSGDTQNNAFIDSNGAHVAPRGIYRTSAVAFRDIPAATTAPSQSTIRFEYTKGSGISIRSGTPVQSSSVDPATNITTFQITEEDMSKSNVLFTLRIDCSQLPKQETSLATFLENSGQKPDPGIVYNPNTGVWAVAHPDGIVSEHPPLPLPTSGIVVVAYVSNQQSGQSSLVVDNLGSVTTRKLRANWSTGMKNGVVKFHGCVLHASFAWSDTTVFRYP